MSGDIHAPTNAGPDLGPAEPAPEYAAGPSSAPDSETDPAVIVGAAFAGGLIAALILKRLVR